MSDKPEIGGLKPEGIHIDEADMAHSASFVTEILKAAGIASLQPNEKSWIKWGDEICPVHGEKKQELWKGEPKMCESCFIEAVDPKQWVPKAWRE